MHPSEHVASAAGSIKYCRACGRARARVYCAVLANACACALAWACMHATELYRSAPHLARLPTAPRAARRACRDTFAHRSIKMHCIGWQHPALSDCRVRISCVRARVRAWGTCMHACDWVCASACVRTQAFLPVRVPVGAYGRSCMPVGAYGRSCMPVCALVCRAGTHRLSSWVYHSR